MNGYLFTDYEVKLLILTLDYLIEQMEISIDDVKQPQLKEAAKCRLTHLIRLKNKIKEGGERK